MTDAISAALAKLLHAQSSLLVETWTFLRNIIFATYHPEQHYMRGPGPKWREKHSGAPVI
jgi:hypothetical protein